MTGCGRISPGLNSSRITTSGGRSPETTRSQLGMALIVRSTKLMSASSRSLGVTAILRVTKTGTGCQMTTRQLL